MDTKENDRLVPHRKAIAEMTGSLFDAAGIPFDQTSELQRQVLAAFAFGMAFAYGQEHRLSPPDVQALAICFLMDVFGYAAHQAAAFSENLIAAASDPNPNNTMKAIIHRGIDGHRRWGQRQSDALSQNIADIFQALGA